MCHKECCCGSPFWMKWRPGSVFQQQRVMGGDELRFLGQWRQFWCDWRVFRRRGCCWKWKQSFRVDLSELSVVSVRDVGQMMIRSDLLQFSRRKLTCIHDFISEGQLVRADWVAGMINLVKTVQLDVGSTTVEGETMSAYDGIGRGM